MLSCRSLLLLFGLAGVALAADPPAKAPQPKKAIIPGQVIVPTGPGEMRRIWGELISLDLKTRTGTFRNESNDEVMSFTVMPYAELLHHATLGDLQDYKVGERAIFRLHQDKDGKWTWLTYIQDEMNFLNGHKEYYWVDTIDPATGRIGFTQANGDKSFVREKGLVLQTDAATRYWKAGKPASFSDIKVSDKLRTKTHGIGKGKVRMCWEVFLDEESLLKFRDDQMPIHRKRMLEEGLPGYVDAQDGKVLRLTLFPSGRDAIKDLKVGQKVRVAPAGVDRKPTAEPVAGTLTEMKAVRNTTQAVVTLEAEAAGFTPAGLARVWIVK